MILFSPLPIRTRCATIARMLAVILLAGCLTTAYARRAQGTKTVVQPDSSQLTLMLLGDESFHCWTTTDGLPVIYHQNSYVYATLENDLLTPTSLIAHNPEARPQTEQQAIAQLNAQQQTADTWSRLAARRNNNGRRMRSSSPAHLSASSSAPWTLPSNPVSGTRRGLVILMEFPDLKMNAKNGREVFERMFNEVGYDEDDHIGSVHDYFLDQSYGALNLQFDIVGPFTAAHDMAYYGENNDRRAYELIIEGCRAADATVDFRNYDWNNTPENAQEVSQVFVIYAGYGEAYGADESTIWQHEWNIAAASRNQVSLTLDGVTINEYACSSELWGTEGERRDGIGTACHEFSHCLGLPDMYDTVGSSFGMGNWDPLGQGDYNGTFANASNIPAGYTALERWYCGWLTPATLDHAADVTDMPALQTSPTAYVIYNDAWDGELYLLENRQLTRWDSCLSGHGMLVLHVDYNEVFWKNNRVNSGNNVGCTIIPADGFLSRTPLQLAGDPYPGRMKNTELTDESTPSAALAHAATDGRKLMGKPITHIAESKDGLISFSFMGGNAAAIYAPSNTVNATDANARTTIHPDDEVVVYGANGTMLKHATFSHWQDSLPRGIYIVRSQTGTCLTIEGGNLR